MSDARFAPNDRYVLIATSGGTIYSWDWKSGAGPHVIASVASTDEASTPGVPCAPVISPQGNAVATVADGGTVDVISLASAGNRRQLRTGYGSGGGTCPWFSPDGRLLAVTSLGDSSFEIWHTGAPGRPVSISAPSPSYLAFSPDGSQVAVDYGDDANRGDEVEVWDLNDVAGAPLVRTLSPPPGLPADPNGIFTSGLEWSPNGSALAVGASDSYVRVFLGRDTSPTYIPSSDNSFGGVAFNPNSQELLTAPSDYGAPSSVGDLDVWRWEAAQPLYNYWRLSSGEQLPADAVAFSADAKLVAVGYPSEALVLWDWRDLSETTINASSYFGGDPYFNAVGFSPDGRYVAATNGSVVVVWSVRTDAPVAHLATGPWLVTTTGSAPSPHWRSAPTANSWRPWSTM